MRLTYFGFSVTNREKLAVIVIQLKTISVEIIIFEKLKFLKMKIGAKIPNPNANEMVYAIIFIFVSPSIFFPDKNEKKPANTTITATIMV